MTTSTQSIAGDIFVAVISNLLAQIRQVTSIAFIIDTILDSNIPSANQTKTYSLALTSDRAETCLKEELGSMRPEQRRAYVVAP